MAKETQSGLRGAALYVGIIVIVAWLATLAWLAMHVDDEEVRWSRLVFLLSSVEAVAFGAAGALFGTNLQGQRVADARLRAERAESEASEHKEAAVRGRALAAVVKSEARSGGAVRGATRSGPDSGEPSASLALANELFP
jgi:hypothetical protein